MIRESWSYYGVYIYPAEPNSAGLRWYARTDDTMPDAPPILRADTKAGMRELIRHYAGKGKR